MLRKQVLTMAFFTCCCLLQWTAKAAHYDLTGDHFPILEQTYPRKQQITGYNFVLNGEEIQRLPIQQDVLYSHPKPKSDHKLIAYMGPHHNELQVHNLRSHIPSVLLVMVVAPYNCKADKKNDLLHIKCGFFKRKVAALKNEVQNRPDPNDFRYLLINIVHLYTTKHGEKFAAEIYVYTGSKLKDDERLRLNFPNKIRGTPTQLGPNKIGGKPKTELGPQIFDLPIKGHGDVTYVFPFVGDHLSLPDLFLGVPNDEQVAVRVQNFMEIKGDKKWEGYYCDSADVLTTCLAASPSFRSGFGHKGLKELKTVDELYKLQDRDSAGPTGRNSAGSVSSSPPRQGSRFGRFRVQVRKWKDKLTTWWRARRGRGYENLPM